jgi:hypothetical protein
MNYLKAKKIIETLDNSSFDTMLQFNHGQVKEAINFLYDSSDTLIEDLGHVHSVMTKYQIIINIGKCLNII